MIIEEEKVEVLEEKSKNNNQNSDQFKQVTDGTPIHKSHLLKYFGLFLLALLVIFIIIFVVFTLINKNSETIAKGIYVYGVDISGLSKQGAYEKISEYFETEVYSKDITLYYEDFKTYIKPDEISLNYDIESAVNYAFSVGKSGNIFKDNYYAFDAMLNGLNIIPTYKIDESSLENILNDISTELPNAVIESSYYIEDSTLIITKGSDGYIVNSDQTAISVKNSISNLGYISEEILLSLTPKSPTPVDIEKIHTEIYKEASDAYYTTDPYAVYPSSEGIDFDISIEEAEELLELSDNEVEIPLKTLYPEVTTNMLGREAFPDLLATFSTRYATSNTNRTTNLRLAASKIDGYVLLPGETFSYNAVVGERTIAAGYKEAAMYQNGEVVDGLGGGICQISTTLFNAVLLSNLEIVELHNHQFVPSYVSAGEDATVVYGSKDFQFKNSRNYAIKIECSVSGGIARFNIYGVKEDEEYDVSIDARVTSRTSSRIKSTTYRILRKGNEVVEREHIYDCTYLTH